MLEIRFACNFSVCTRVTFQSLLFYWETVAISIYYRNKTDWFYRNVILVWRITKTPFHSNRDLKCRCNLVPVAMAVILKIEKQTWLNHTGYGLCGFCTVSSPHKSNRAAKQFRLNDLCFGRSKWMALHLHNKYTVLNNNSTEYRTVMLSMMTPKLYF